MAQQVPIDPSAHADSPSADRARDDGTNQVAPDLAYKRAAIANVIFVGLPNSPSGGWVLVDAGVMGTAGLIAGAAEERFGKGSRPAAIVLTHGHFDHVGALQELAEQWDVPVVAHTLEAPYLNGSASYPPPDPKVGGGLMSLLSPLYPRSPVHVASRLQLLPEDGSVPFMPGWKWIHAPGHTPGQVAFWRESDRALIAADAFITTAQESAYAVATQKPEMHGPPAYFTQDWIASRATVEKLAALGPEVVITGHGPAMSGPEMRASLEALARDFDRVAVPDHGRYVEHPTRAEDGSAYDRS